MSKNQFTRRELYDLVWAKPFSTLAKEFDISDNGLRKICKKYNVPFPQHGHWQKVQFGKKVVQTKLPTDTSMDDTTVVLLSRESHDESPQSRLHKLTKEIETLYPNYLAAPERLVKVDPLVLKAQEDLKTKKPWSTRDPFVSSPGVLAIEVAKENVNRALCFMEGFIKLARARGHKIEVSSQYTVITVNGEAYNLRCREKRTRILVKPGTWPQYEYTLNGKLSLKLDALFGQEWIDGSNPLEKQLAKIIAALELRAEKDKIERAEREAYWAEQKRLEAIKKMEAERRAWELKKGELLLNLSAQWGQARQLQMLISEVEKLNPDPAEKVATWLQWAKEQLHNLNPLAAGTNEFIEKFQFRESHVQ